MLQTCSRWIATLVLCFGAEALGQPIPSAISILPSGSGTASDESETEPAEIDSPRYEKRVQPQRRPSPEMIRSPQPAPQAVVTPHSEVARPLPSATVFEAVAPAPGESAKASSKPTVGEEIRDLVIGGSGEHIERYQNFLAPDDIRRNGVELEIAPGFLYNESQSQAWSRSYNQATPTGRLGLGVWFTPFFGVHTGLTKTFLGSAQKQFNSSSQTPTSDQWLTIGLRFRRFSSSSATAPGLTFGIDYSDYQRRIPADDLFRNKISTSGLLLSAETRLPASETVAWLAKLEYMPIASHREEPLGREVKSGNSPQTFQAGVSLGPEFKLNRGNRLFLRGRVLYERNAFTGSANTANPGTGEFPENVIVSNTFMFVEMGYIWGN